MSEHGIVAKIVLAYAPTSSEKAVKMIGRLNYSRKKTVLESHSLEMKGFSRSSPPQSFKDAIDRLR